MVEPRKGAGYSGTPLAKKLGIKPNDRVVVKYPPENYEQLIEPIPDGARVSRRLSNNNRVIHLFVKRRAILERDFPKLVSHLRRDGMIWVSWPKKASGVATDVDEGVVRSIGLQNGVVDVKICAVDETWSGLKFVFRLKDR